MKRRDFIKNLLGLLGIAAAPALAKDPVNPTAAGLMNQDFTMEFWGKGPIDDVKISTIARYHANFTPPRFNLNFGTSLDDKWHHYALVREGHTFKFYIDGDLWETTTQISKSNFAPLPMDVRSLWADELGKSLANRIDQEAYRCLTT